MTTNYCIQSCIITISVLSLLSCVGDANGSIDGWPVGILVGWPVSGTVGILGGGPVGNPVGSLHGWLDGTVLE